jgi:tricorn protease
MRITAIAIAATFLLSTAGPASAEPIKFARYPHASHGKLVFSYHGDIWVANEDGSNPLRLTAHVAKDTFPRISPDGRWVAFSSDRFGNDDVFLVPIAGGEPKQLTFATTGDTVLNWMPDGKGILVATSRAVSPWRSPLYVVPIDGSLPMPLPMDGGVQGMVKPDGTMIAFNRSGGSYWRKGYRGNRADDIWVQNLATKAVTRLTDTNLRDYKDFTQV